MKALKSKLAEELARNNVRVPRQEGAEFLYKGIKYTVRKVPKPKGK